MILIKHLHIVPLCPALVLCYFVFAKTENENANDLDLGTMDEWCDLMVCLEWCLSPQGPSYLRH